MDMKWITNTIGLIFD